MIALTINHIRGMTPEAISRLSAPELALLLADLAEEKERLGGIENRLRHGLDRRYGERARRKRAEEGKATGTVRFEDNGFVVIADLPKHVRWGHWLLAQAHWFDAVRRLFTPARTVETGRAVYRIEPSVEEGS